MNIPFSPPDISEREIESVVETLRSGWITTGPKTKEFEKQIAAYVGTERVVCLNSSTAAMEMTLRLLGIGPGDEVIVPAYTYTASCSVICHVGATPVMWISNRIIRKWIMQKWRKQLQNGRKSSFRLTWQESYAITRLCIVC